MAERERIHLAQFLKWNSSRDSRSDALSGCIWLLIAIRARHSFPDAVFRAFAAILSAYLAVIRPQHTSYPCRDESFPDVFVDASVTRAGLVPLVGRSGIAKLVAA
jgi:hypothetical protein